MKLKGRAGIQAPRSTVWTFVTDPDLIAGCLPGVQSIEKLGHGRFRAHARVKLGFFSAKVVVEVEYTELRAPDDATVHARAQAPGSGVEVTAKLALTDGPDHSTAVDWTADVEISGMLAGVGGPQIEETAGRMIGAALDCVRVKLED
jgi:carbon monoxide dehydrogenase subunit G